VDYRWATREPFTLNLYEIITMIGAFLNFIGCAAVSFNNKLPLNTEAHRHKKRNVRRRVSLYSRDCWGSRSFSVFEDRLERLKGKKFGLVLSSVVAYVLLSGLLISVSRTMVFHSILVTSASRYTMVSSYFWAVLVVCLYVQIQKGRNVLKCQTVIAVIVLLFAVSYVHSSMALLRNRHFLVLNVAEDVKKGDYSPAAKTFDK